MNIEFIAGIAVIAADPERSRGLFIGALGLPLEAANGSDYFHSERIEGTKHFGVWPLSEAAQACFGTVEWPDDRTVPQVSVEFEVHDRRRSHPPPRNSASEASLCCMAAARSHGARPWPGFNRQRARSSGSRTRRHCGPDPLRCRAALGRQRR